MLPFVRMFDYGNIIEVNNIKKSVVSYTLEMFLMQDGTVYAHGEDSNYNAGLSTQFVSLGAVQQITTEVDDLWLGSFSVVIKGDKIYGSGSTYAFTNSNTFQQGYTDWAVYFTGIDVTQIKKMLCGYTAFILMKDGTLYGRGWNRSGALGLGHKNYVSAWTVLDTNVDNIFGGYLGDTVFKIKNDGTVYGSGSNNSFQVKATSGDATTFVPLFDDISYDIKCCFVSGVGFVMITSDNKIYATGTTFAGSGAHIKVFDVGFTIGDMSNIYHPDSLDYSTSVVFLINADTNKLIATGHTPFTGSSSSSLPYFTAFQEFNFTSFNSNTRYSGSLYWNTFYEGNNVWMNGYNPKNTGGKNFSLCSIPLDTIITKQIDLPF
ncbi:hypothetical protein QMU05_000322 [Escherichia coli]|nr:hypothetical protein [Escherichia coli]